MAVPGTVAGLALALERFGTISLAEAIAPAIEFAERGFPVTWHTTLKTAQDLALVARTPPAALSLPTTAIPGIRRTNRRRSCSGSRNWPRPCARSPRGPRAFYEGAVVRQIVDNLVEQGEPFATEDLSNYEATVGWRWRPYGDAVIHSTGGGTGGTTISEAMMSPGRVLIGAGMTSARRLPAPAGRVLQDRFCRPLRLPGRSRQVAVPMEALLSPEYIESRRSEIDPAARLRPRRGPCHPGHHAPPCDSVPDYTSDGSTTHHSVIDRNGMAVSTTKTLLSLWGSGVTIPGTGISMNNGMMWFDPQPGRPNSVAGGKKPLANMAPIVVTRNNQSLAAIGASGGRRILNCNIQIGHEHDRSGHVNAGSHPAPRIDRSTPSVSHRRFDHEMIAEVERRGHRLIVKDERKMLGKNTRRLRPSRTPRTELHRRRRSVLLPRHCDWNRLVAAPVSIHAPCRTADHIPLVR